MWLGERNLIFSWILRGKIWVGGGKKIKIKRAQLIFIHPKTYINSCHLLLTIHLG
jgi:hypothetical protein